jgi:hypothetical protein
MALHLDAAGENVYYACSSFREPFITVPDKKTGEPKKRERVQDNVLLVRSFWLDLDVGASEPNKPAKYASQAEAIKALGALLKDTGLPCPMVVSSGYGLHCYWPLSEDILVPQWVTAAKMLKELCANTGMMADPTRTADHASVLRPVGTFNKKYNAPKIVEVVRDADPISFAEFYALLRVAAAAKGLVSNAAESKTPAVSVNDKFLVKSDYAESTAELVADRCPQIRAVRDTGGSVPEPVWYGAIQVLFHTVENEQVIHAWSSGYAGYSHSETAKKIDQIREMGPTTCETFGTRNPLGCVGCPFKGKITSPIQLGVQRKSLAAPVVVQHDGIQEVKVEVPNPPFPFVRTEHGIFIEIEAGVQQKILPYDLYLSEVVDDEHADSRASTAHYKLPMDPQEYTFSLPFNITGSAAELDKYLRSKGVICKQSKLMVAYVTSYIEELQAKTRTRKLVQSMGWKDENRSFIFGRKVFNADGTASETTLSSKFGSSIEGFAQRGELSDWVNATSVLASPGMQAHAFSLLLGFGAPLLKLTGHNGVLFSLMGKSGGGKTTMANWLTSIWGSFEKLKLGLDDTELSRIERIGSFCNLPVYMDEASNMPGEEISKVAYRITRGEGRKRLRPDASERPASTWSTFLIMSTNQSLQSKLETNKGDSYAEQVRLFEYEVPVIKEMDEKWRDINAMLAKTYGVAGEVFARYIVQNVTTVKAMLRKIEDTIIKAADCSGEERFWVAGASCAIAGGLIARSLGLVQFEIKPVLDWVIQQFTSLRKTVADAYCDEITLLGAYLDQYSPNRIVVGKFDPKTTGRMVDVIKHPHGELLHRLELHNRVLYVSTAHIKKCILERSVDFNRFRKSLITKGILVDASAKMTLGAGTVYTSVQIPAWKINLMHPAFADLIDNATKEDVVS